MHNSLKNISVIAYLTCIAGITFCSGCAGSSCRVAEVTQFSTIDSLLTGIYDGKFTVSQLKEKGDLGIGTTDCLDGEMLILDGEAFTIRSDGIAYKLSDTDTTPFASVVNFKPSKTVTLSNISDFHGFIEQIDKEIQNQNAFVALRLQGKFSGMKTRSVPKQSKPYPPLIQVTQHQPKFEFQDTEGDLIGFRLPPYVKGINVPGWHLHFITKDQKAGGHVLNFSLKEGNGQICEVYDFQMHLPENSKAFRNTDLSVDRSEELKKVESDH